MFDNPIAIGVAVILIVLLVAGPKRLPRFGRGLGQGMREFKHGISGEAHDFKEGITGGSTSEEQAAASARRVPRVGRGLGQSMREFGEGVATGAHEFKEGITGEPAPDEQISLKTPAQQPSEQPPSSSSTGRESDAIA